MNPARVIIAPCMILVGAASSVFAAPARPTVTSLTTGAAFTNMPHSVPFSFQYAGVEFSPSRWSFVDSVRANAWSRTYTDPSGVLQATIQMISYPESGATKWFLVFQNVGTVNSAEIKNVNIAHLA